VLSLGGEPPEQSRTLLFRAMGDDSWRVRKEAVAVLSRQPLHPETVNGLIALLRSSDNAGLRNSAVESLERLGAGAVAALCSHLDDPDHDLRKFVIDILGNIGSPSCLPLLVRALDDADPNVRVAAAENLGKLGDPAALPHLLKILDGGEVWLKFTVLDALALIGVAVPLSSLEPLLRESLLKRAIYDCLGALGDAGSIPVLVGGLQEKGKNAREAAALALMRVRGRLAEKERQTLVDLPLAALKGSETAKPLISLLSSTDPAVLEPLVQLVGTIGDERATAALLSIAADERVRGTCLDAFRGIGAAAVPELLSLFPEAGAAERAQVAHLLGELGNTYHLELLFAGLDDETPELRAACAASLGKLAPQAASRPVAKLLEDAHAQVREAALEALQRMATADPEAIAAICGELALSASARQRRDAALLLCSTKDGDRLSRLAKDEEGTVRRAAVASIAKIGNPQALPHLAMALADEEPEVRLAAAQGLAESGQAEALEPLLLALNDQDPWVQTAALKGLAALRDPASLAGIAALLGSARGPVQIAALSTLAAVGGAGALAPVKAALLDSDEEVVEAAIGIMSGFGAAWVREYAEALMAHPHWGVRRALVRAMAELQGGGALPALQALLANESDSLVRGEIAALIDRLA
jgi:HEAT repeat protein